MTNSLMFGLIYFILFYFILDVSHYCVLQLPRVPSSENDFPFGTSIKYFGHCSKRNRATATLSDSDDDNEVFNSNIAAGDSMECRFERTFPSALIGERERDRVGKSRELKNKNITQGAVTIKMKTKDNNDCSNVIDFKSHSSHDVTASASDESTYTYSITNTSDDNSNHKNSHDHDDDDDDDDRNETFNCNNSDDENNSNATTVTATAAAVEQKDMTETSGSEENMKLDDIVVDVDIGIQSENTSVEMSITVSSSSSTRPLSSTPSHIDSDTNSSSSQSHSSLSFSRSQSSHTGDDYNNLSSKRSHISCNNKHNLRISSHIECNANGLEQEKNGNMSGVDNADSPITDGSESP